MGSIPRKDSTTNEDKIETTVLDDITVNLDVFFYASQAI